MVDVKEPTAQTQGEPTPAPVAGSEPLQAPESTAKAPAAEPQTPAQSVQEPQEPTVPRSALLAERRKWQKRLREREGQSGQDRQVPQYNPDDPNAQSQYVQSLESQVAESQLKDKARDLLKDYPELPKHIKQAILRNPLGFCKSGTKTVNAGVLDIQDYVEEIVEGLEDVSGSQPTPKTVQVAGSNTPATSQPGATPADVQKILNKPVFEWTDAEVKLVSDYKASHT